MSNLDDYPEFKEYVWDNPSLCNNCYRRVKQVLPLSKDEYRNSLQQSLSDTVHFRTEDGTIAYRVEEVEGEEMHIYRATTSCGQCGSVGCVSIPDSVSKRKLLKRLDRIIHWLEKQDADPDEKVMRGVVHDLKGDPDNQGEDPEILAEAVEKGL